MSRNDARRKPLAAVPVILTGLVLILLASIAVWTCRLIVKSIFQLRETRREMATIATEALPQSPPPKCIHEVCGERPATLIGTGCVNGGCDRYRIIYEHHCQCDAWAPTDEPRPVEKPRD